MSDVYRFTDLDAENYGSSFVIDEGNIKKENPTMNQKLNKHGLPILGTKTLKKNDKKDYKLCKAKGCIYEGEKEFGGLCVEHYAELQMRSEG